MAGAARAQASEMVGTGQTVETPAPAKRADGARRSHVSQTMKALAEKTLEVRELDIDMSQREVADYIETHCTEKEKGLLKRGWQPRGPINKDDVSNAWSRDAGSLAAGRHGSEDSCPPGIDSAWSAPILPDST